MNRHENRGREIEIPASSERIARAVDEELSAHIEERVADLTSSGLAQADARAQALREFGDVGSTSYEMQRIDRQAALLTRVRGLLVDLAVDARRTLRGLARRPAFSLIAVGTLALGIGANAAMFGLVDRLLLSGPPGVDTEGLVRMQFKYRYREGGEITMVRGSYPFYRELAGRTDLFERVGGYADRQLTLAVGQSAREVAVAAVTSDYFATFNLRSMALGRALTATGIDDERSVVLGHEIWMQQFGGSPAVLDQPVRIGGEMFRVVGVTPRGFTGDGIQHVDAWIPLGISTPTIGSNWASAATFTYGRLRPNVSWQQAETELTRMFRDWATATSGPDSTTTVLLRGFIPGQMADGTLNPDAKVAVWLQGVSLLVLLIAIANVVNLLLLRGIERARETSVCLALGISRLRLLRNMSLEAVLLATIGGVIAVALARWLGPALWNVILPHDVDAGPLAGRLTLAAAGVALFCAVIMVTVPAFLQRRAVEGDTLRTSRGASRGTSKLADGLVVLQVALTVVLLVGAGLFIRSMERLDAIELGFTPTGIVGARITPSADATPGERAQLLSRIEARLRELPDVATVVMGQSSPFRASLGTNLRLPGKDLLPGVGAGQLGQPTAFAISPGYLDALEISVLAGRGVLDSDLEGSERVMLVDATMARTFWPAGDAIGQCVLLGPENPSCTTVVGIVEDTKRALVQPMHSLRYFVPLAQTPFPGRDRYFFVRSSRVSPVLVDRVRATVAELAPTAPFVEAFELESLKEVYTRQWRLGSAAFLTFGALATLVAGIGLFGVVSFGVARRQRELGIRRALGESAASVWRRVVIGALAKTGLGLAVGALLSVVLNSRLKDLLYEPTITDAVVFLVAMAVVVGATLLATLRPAVRATRADPIVALRAE